MSMLMKVMCMLSGAHRYQTVVTRDVGAFWAAERCERCGFETIGTLLQDLGR